MARPPPDPAHDPDPLKGGLTHHPFAALRRANAGAPTPPSTPPAPAESASTPAARETASRERVTVRQERRGHGGKTVTLASGPGLAGADLDELAREIARALGSGARAEGGELVVQGDQRERLRAWLLARGYAGVVLGN